MHDFPCKLKTLRKAKGINQVQLATILGISKQIIASYETGYRKPGINNLMKFARYFKVTTDYLLGLEDNSNKVIDVSTLNQMQVNFVKRTVSGFKKANREL